jgi:hypothetical protein
MLRGQSGVFVENGDSEGYRRSLNVRFDDNTYRADRVRPQFMGEGNELYRIDAWRRLGNDRNSRVVRPSTRGSLPDGAVAFRRLAVYGAQPEAAP